MRFGFHAHHHGHDHEHGHRGMHAMRGHMRGGHWGFGGREGFEEGRGGGRRRLFDGGELRLVLLSLIGEQPRHGYDLIRAIEERTGGAYAPSPGVVYPTLTLLTDMGQIEEQVPDGAGSGNRKLFGVTEEGQRVLTEKAEEIAALMARLDALAEVRERTESVSIRRSLHNLRLVLTNKLGARDVDADTMHEAVALIDEVARKIERL